ncbi:hypothetical protein LP417_23540 [Polaromonas sp. P1-6]|nr:hypothetical protein LP417_23540 [Polaromonas sp. P1-6]
MLGPVIGSALIILLPEIARPLAEYRQIVVGVVLVVVVIFTPQGLGDTFLAWLAHKRAHASGAPPFKPGKTTATATTEKNGDAYDCA